MKVQCVGDRYLAVTDQDVADGEIIEVDDVLGRSLLEQPSNWLPVKADKKGTAVPESDGA